MELEDLKRQIASASDQSLADELFQAYDELKKRYFRADFRPGQLEGGRFAEAAWRILELQVGGTFTPIGKNLRKVPDLIALCEAGDAAKVHESIRLHIPRALAAVYNVRNRRDVGHIAADVDANVMDAEYVVATCNWVLAEFIRLFHSCSPEQARAYVEGVVKRPAPLVQVFGDTPFVLRKGLAAREEILLLLYHQGSVGATVAELNNWLPTVKKSVIHARVGEMERDDRFVRRLNGRVNITDAGAAFVEDRIFKR